jgi:hypothetical protein
MATSNGRRWGDISQYLFSILGLSTPRCSLTLMSHSTFVLGSRNLTGRKGRENITQNVYGSEGPMGTVAEEREVMISNPAFWRVFLTELYMLGC